VVGGEAAGPGALAQRGIQVVELLVAKARVGPGRPTACQRRQPVVSLAVSWVPVSRVHWAAVWAFGMHPDDLTVGAMHRCPPDRQPCCEGLVHRPKRVELTTVQDVAADDLDLPLPPDLWLGAAAARTAGSRTP
jgi:hypothetical protein